MTRTGERLRPIETVVGGSLIRPDDATYDERRRIWNGVRRRPKALVVRWAGVRGATRYEVALTPSRGRQRFVTTRGRSLVLRRVPKTVRGSVSVRAVDRLRQGRTAKPNGVP